MVYCRYSENGRDDRFRIPAGIKGRMSKEGEYMDLQEMKKTAEYEILHYRESAAFAEGWLDGGGADAARYRDRMRWVWAVERVRTLLKKTNPEKERFFAELYQLDRPHGRIRPCEAITRLSIEMFLSPSTLYRWREELLLSVAVAAVQSQALKPF